jgi:iron complex outermembrane receptor protein
MTVFTKASVRLAAALLASTSLPVYAQTAQPPAKAAAEERNDLMPEIVVTATRRETSLQTTAIAVSAVTSDDLERARVDDVRQLSSLAPSLLVTGQAGQEFPIALRGISSGGQAVGGDSPIAIYLDGVYLGRQMASIFDLPDTERIEVSRGPQGTLFGRNNTAGAINIITIKPSEGPTGRLLARFGTRNEMAIKGFYATPLSDKVAVKFGATARRIDGFETWRQTGKKVNGEEAFTLSTGLTINPTEGLDLDFRADYTKAVLGLHVRHLTPGTSRYGLDMCPIDCDVLDAEDSSEFEQNQLNYGASFTATYNFGNDMTLKAITGWRRSVLDYLSNNDSTEFVIQRFQYYSEAKQFSQEVNLSQTTDDFSWVAGLYYFKEKTQTPYALDYFPGPGAASQVTAADAGLDILSYAAYADGTYNITDRLSFSAGARFSREKKSFIRYDGVGISRYTPGYIETVPLTRLAFDLKRQWDSVSPRASLNYKFSPDIFGYATISKGDKSGGFSFSGGGTADVSFDPEKVIAYEIGLKNMLFDRQLRLNLSAFYYDYTGLQIAVANSAAVRTTFNAASAKVKGFEAEFLFAPRTLTGFTLSGNLSLLDATYSDFLLPVANRPSCIGGIFIPATSMCDLTGKSLPRAPKFSTTVFANYEADIGIGTLTPQIKMTHTSQLYYTEQNDPFAGKEATTEFDAQLSFKPKDTSLTVTAWVRNLTDQRYIYNARQANIRASNIPNSPFNQNIVGEYGLPNPPRTYGIEMSYKF